MSPDITLTLDGGQIVEHWRWRDAFWSVRISCI